MSETNLTGIEIQLRVSQLVNQGKAIFTRRPLAIDEGIEFIASLRDEDPRVMAYVQAQLATYFAEEVERTQKRGMDRRANVDSYRFYCLGHDESHTNCVIARTLRTATGLAALEEQRRAFNAQAFMPQGATFCSIRNEPIARGELHAHSTGPSGELRCDKTVGIATPELNPPSEEYGGAVTLDFIERLSSNMHRKESNGKLCDLAIPPPDPLDALIMQTGYNRLPSGMEYETELKQWTCTNHLEPITYTDGTSKCYCGAEKSEVKR